MAEPIKLTTEGILLNWLKDVGDTVNAGDVIAEIEADKATVEIEAPAGGVLIELSAQPGDELSEGAVIGTIGEEGEAPAGGAEAAEAEEAPAAEEEAEAVEEEAPEEAREPARAGAQNGRRGEAAPSGNGMVAATTPEGRIKVSPLARRMAEDKGIDLSQVRGSGPGGRIVKADIEEFKPAEAPAREEAAPAAAPSEPVERQTWGAVPEEDVEILEISRMRRRIVDGTVLSKQQIPHFYVTMDIDVAAMLELRKELNESLVDEGVKISVNDMIVKATALALKKFPNLNTHYYGDKMVRHKRINVGIAVALPDNGLMNLVAHDADKTALSALAEQNKAMYERAREGKVKPDDMRGATFTISNLGPWDVEDFAAIISPPEAGILAIGAARKVPVVQEDGSIGVGQRMKATISVDHRVSDGAEGADFLKEFRSLIENPMRLLV